ncbi:MAG: QueT transporter family protein [Oscillospiraceae bacterium]|nr:QueT transporter family protein [Oscillospiraceae bacterium]
MKKRARFLAHAAIIAALYAVLTHFQNVILPGSATWMIQMRLSEALCILAFFTPAAPMGLAIGCMVFNLTFAAALPLDFLVGTVATYLAGKTMWMTRKVTVFGLPVLGLTMPALWNALLVGAELAVYIGGGFWINALYVALGELAVLLCFGSVLYLVMKRRQLDTILFDRL